MGDNGKENGNYYNGLYGWLSKLWSLFGFPTYWVPDDRDPKRTIILTTTHIGDSIGLRA